MNTLRPDTITPTMDRAGSVDERSAPIGQAALLLVESDQDRAGTPEMLAKIKQPYHQYVMQWTAGVAEGTERYLSDYSLVFTNLVQTQTSPRHIADVGTESTRWIQNKYPKSSLANRFLNRPYEVVSSWLTVLGPHNDMVGASDDLVRASDWLSAETSGSLATDLQWSLATEIAEQPDVATDKKMSALSDSITALEDSQVKNIKEEQLTKSCETAAKLCSARVMRDMLDIYGTLEPDMDLESPDSNTYRELEARVQSHLAELEAFLESGAKAALSQVEHRELSESALGNMAGSFFETFAYATMLAGIIDSKSLLGSSVRPATTREDNGSVHANYPEGKQAGQQEVFNGNFDVSFSQRSKSSDGTVQTGKTYIQLKVNPNFAKQAKADRINEKLPKGKRFMYLDISAFATIPNFDPSGSRQMLRAINTFVTIDEYLSIRNEGQRLTIPTSELTVPELV